MVFIYDAEGVESSRIIPMNNLSSYLSRKKFVIIPPKTEDWQEKAATYYADLLAAGIKPDKRLKGIIFRTARNKGAEEVRRTCNAIKEYKPRDPVAYFLKVAGKNKVILR